MTRCGDGGEGFGAVAGNPAVRSVLVTGANGFVGSSLTRALLARGIRVRMTGRERSEPLAALGAEWFPMPDLSGEVDWSPTLAGMDAVVHLAAVAHRFESVTPEMRTLYDQVNHRATRSLAAAIAREPGVRRFLFISSVRVHGDPVSLPVREDSPMAPVTPYDSSKVDAENAVREWLAPGSARWAILRPAMVYGPGNRGNMAKLEGLIRAGIPVPLPRRPNRRSFLFIGNLVSAMETYLTAGDPPSGRTWILADPTPASTEDLVRALGRSMEIRVRLMHLPDWILDGGAGLGDLCRRAHLPFPWTTEVKQKLLGDFFVDISAVRTELGWNPPFTLEQGLALTHGTTGPPSA